MRVTLTLKSVMYINLVSRADFHEAHWQSKRTISFRIYLASYSLLEPCTWYRKSLTKISSRYFLSFSGDKMASKGATGMWFSPFINGKQETCSVIAFPLYCSLWFPVVEQWIACNLSLFNGGCRTFNKMLVIVLTFHWTFYCLMAYTWRSRFTWFSRRTLCRSINSKSV